MALALGWGHCIRGAPRKICGYRWAKVPQGVKPAGQEKQVRAGRMAKGFAAGLVHGGLVCGAGLVALSLIMPQPPRPLLHTTPATEPTAEPETALSPAPALAPPATPGPAQPLPEATTPEAIPDATSPEAAAPTAPEPAATAPAAPVAGALDLPLGSEFARGTDSAPPRPAPMTLIEPPQPGAPQVSTPVTETVPAMDRSETRQQAPDAADLQAPPTAPAIAEVAPEAAPLTEAAPPRPTAPALAPAVIDAPTAPQSPAPQPPAAETGTATETATQTAASEPAAAPAAPEAAAATTVPEPAAEIPAPRPDPQPQSAPQVDVQEAAPQPETAAAQPSAPDVPSTPEPTPEAALPPAAAPPATGARNAPDLSTPPDLGGLRLDPKP